MFEDKATFGTATRQATLYPSSEAGAPLVVLNEFSGDGTSVVAALERVGSPCCSLLVPYEYPDRGSLLFVKEVS